MFKCIDCCYNCGIEGHCADFCDKPDKKLRNEDLDMQILNVKKEDDSSNENNGVAFSFINLEIEVVQISDSVEGGKREMTVEASENKIYLYIIVDDDSNNNTED